MMKNPRLHKYDIENRNKIIIFFTDIRISSTAFTPRIHAMRNPLSTNHQFSITDDLVGRDAPL